MHSPSFRRIARVFACVLLLWTAADVCDYGLCSHHRGLLGRFEQAAFREVTTTGDSTVEAPDDCFCCSHVVDVRTPFRMALRFEVAWAVTDESAGQPQLTSNPLYHPPLG